MRSKPKIELPPKPYATFPLQPYGNGQWAKKIDGKRRYFGKWAWPDEAAYEKSWRDALEAYDEQLKATAMGEELIVATKDITLKMVINGFIGHLEAKLDKGNITAGRFADIRVMLTDLADAIGRGTSIRNLEKRVEPMEEHPFSRHLSALDSRYGYYRYNSYMQVYRQMFKWAASPTFGMLPRPFKWVDLLSKKPIRQWRAERERRKQDGDMLVIEPAELRTLIDLAYEPLRTMMVLAYFGAYGNDDLGQLPHSQLVISDGKDGVPAGWGVLHYPRPKTLIERLCVIPPSVVELWHKAHREAPKTRVPEYRRLLFRTSNGLPMTGEKIHRDEQDSVKKVNRRDNVRLLWKYLIARVGRCSEHGIVRGDECPQCGARTEKLRSTGFYSIRRTAITRASGSADMDVLKLFEGHTLDPIRAKYLVEVERDRFVPVARQLAAKIGWPIDHAPTRNPLPAASMGAQASDDVESPSVSEGSTPVRKTA